MKWLLVLLLLPGCSSVDYKQSRSLEGQSIIRSALVDIFSGGYALGKTERRPIAICFPTMVDPPKGFLESINRTNVHPCSALASKASNAPRILQKTGEWAVQCSISKVQVDADNQHARVEGSCVDEPLSGGGFEVTLVNFADGWKVVEGHTTWLG